MSSIVRLLPLLVVLVAHRVLAQPGARGAADSLLLTSTQLRDRLTRGNLVLLHVGETTSILDGGFAAWKAEGGPVTRPCHHQRAVSSRYIRGRTSSSRRPRFAWA